jgi:tight adherence protein B
MAETGLVWLGAALAGLAAGVAVLQLSAGVGPGPARAWLERARPSARARAEPEPAGSGWLRRLASSRWTPARDRLALWLERAGWPETPERFLAALALVSTGLGALAGCLGGLAGVGPALAPLVAAAVPVVALQLLLARAAERRRRTLDQLAPLLELLSLELSAGGSLLAALGSVSAQTEGELAGDLRNLLIASQLAGSASFEQRLEEYAERAGLPPLAALATLIRTSRDYGSGVGEGVRALALDLRRSRRRDLIAISRRALNRVLIPAAVGVLLPFIGILLYPAVATLWSSFR